MLRRRPSRAVQRRHQKRVSAVAPSGAWIDSRPQRKHASLIPQDRLVGMSESDLVKRCHLIRPRVCRHRKRSVRCGRCRLNPIFREIERRGIAVDQCEARPGRRRVCPGS
jgi:hypothetical protein